ncbi:BTAD domain-containing putative transcriptional regulator [Streptomyces sp. NPDC085946]|uniref:AfsR/SARP family transcriptional regulator n=1 Tax=Streptomyces sp. NPDC085946 TaxID=3365744 RepID=UPI0037D92288
MGPPKQRALLALLSTHRGTVVGPSQIIDGLWGPAAPNTAMNGVHTYIAGLRRALDPARRGRESGGILLSVAGGYELRLPLESVDAPQFVQQFAEARRLSAQGRPDAAFEMLGKALALWRGDALAGVPGPFAALERSRLREMRFSAAEDWISGMIAVGRSEEAIVVTSEAVAQEPLREKLRWLLMLALYRSGRQAHALQAYGEARCHLREELGIEPGAELQDLHARILAGTVDDGATRRQAPSAGPTLVQTPSPAESERAVLTRMGLSPRQLPSRARMFIGRDTELEQVCALLGRAYPARGRATPIVAIDGRPGVGKSALALELAHESADRFPDGQLYADLGGTGECPTPPFHVLGRLLESLGVGRADLPVDLDSRAMLYRSLLHDRQMMILLDDAVDMEQIGPLVPQGSACLIVTSRRPQRGLVARYGAHRIGLKPLCPGPAAELLGKLLGGEGERAAVHQLAELCGHLPLSVRITAAALLEDPYTSPEQLAALYKDPTVRLDLLTVAGDDGMSLRASLTASYRSLPNETAHLFRLLGRVGLEEVGVPESSQLSGVHSSEVAARLELLADLGLLERIGAGTYRLDDLTRVFAIECAEEEWVAPRPSLLRRAAKAVPVDGELRTG